MDLADQLYALLSDFASPQKRVFVGYLAVALAIALCWLVIAKGMSASGAVRKVFDRRILLSDSAIADYKIFAVNRVVGLLVSPLLVSQLAIATAIYFGLHEIGFVRSGQFSGANAALVVALFSVAMFVADDLTKYLLHRWMHKWPALWAIHKVHHSATTLTPITVYRVHPLEGLLYATRSAAAQGVTIPVFVFLFGSTVDLYAVAGVNVLVFAFHVAGSNLRHSHVQIGYWPWVERILISPAQHQVHHSLAEEHHDRNFGAALAVWDWMFGSLALSEPGRELSFGLDARENAHHSDLASIYARPFFEIAEIARRRLRRAGAKAGRLVDRAGRRLAGEAAALEGETVAARKVEKTRP